MKPWERYFNPLITLSFALLSLFVIARLRQKPRQSHFALPANETPHRFKQVSAQNRVLNFKCALGKGGGLELGVGDRYDQVVNGRNLVVYKEAEKDGLRFKYVAIWLCKGWDTSWVSRHDLAKIVADGYTPFILYYYFGDSISKEYLTADNCRRLKEWEEDIERVGELINLPNGAAVLVALEPEFNDGVFPGETPITEWEGFNDVVIAAVQRLKTKAPNCKVGLVAGDWGDFNLDRCIKRAVKVLDFLGFQEMRAATAPEVNESGYKDVALSAVRFSRYLKRFKKPILLAYLAVSSYKDGDPLGWEKEQAEIIREVLKARNELVKNGVFALVYFAYFDDPTHQTLYFGEAERFFGLKTQEGVLKSAFFELNKIR